MENTNEINEDTFFVFQLKKKQASERVRTGKSDRKWEAECADARFTSILVYQIRSIVREMAFFVTVLGRVVGYGFFLRDWKDLFRVCVCVCVGEFTLLLPA
jgi:hypothetical protein